MSTRNEFRSVHSQLESPMAAVADLMQQLALRPSSSRPTLVVLFASPQHSEALPEIGEAVSDQLRPQNMLGCTGESIIAADLEFEHEPCISLLVAWLPAAQVELMHLTYQPGDGGGAFEGWKTLADCEPSEVVTLLTLGEPYSFPADVFLQRVNSTDQKIQVIGGMAGGGAGPGEAKLLINGRVRDQGAVVAVIRGTKITPVVSQGCRPIGQPLVITKAEQNVIFELSGKKAVPQLQAIYDRLPNRDKELVRKGIHIGRVVNEYQESFDYGDFLIRNVAGLDTDDESILVGDYFRPGQTVQFHVRDAESASRELRQMLERSSRHAEVQAALSFTCNGRGSRLFEKPHHDARCLTEQFGELPNAGFFCQGEIGPIAGVNFLHGFTASFALFS